MASPKPQPTAIKQARGNPGKRPLNKNEPQPSKEMPQCPEKLSAAARSYWQKLAPEAWCVGVLTRMDAAAFGRYCSALADWDFCDAFLQANGPDLVVTNKETGEVLGVTPTPYPKRKRELEELLLKYEDRFGFNPSSRSKIQALPTDDGDELDELLGPSLKLAQ